MESIIKEILSEALEIETDELSRDLDLSDIDTWDSIAIVSCLAEIDDQLNIIVDGQKLSECKNPEEIYSLVKSYE